MTKITVLVVLLCGGLFWSYWARNYSNVEVSTGSAYGFSIGDEKRKSLENLSRNFKDSGLVYYVDNTANDKIFNGSLSDTPFFMASDAWKFYVRGNSKNQLELNFETGKLTRINRYVNTTFFHADW